MHTTHNRDKYISINEGNINDTKKSNFKKQSRFEVSNLGYPYDYESIMHYSEGAFSKNGKPTINVLVSPIAQNIVKLL